MFGKEYAPFFERPFAYVVGRIKRTDDFVSPRIKIEDEALYIAIGIAKKGFYGGDPEKVLNAPVSMIQSIERFEAFENDYVDTFKELNNGGRR